MKVRSRRRIYIGWVRGASGYLQVIFYNRPQLKRRRGEDEERG